MSDIRLSTTIEPTAKGRPGRKPRYGVATVKRNVYYPPALLEKVQQEAAWRNARAGNPDEWSVSSTVVDILLDHFGMDKPHAQNGHGDA